MEGVLRGQQQELESLMLSVKNSEEKCKKAVSDASRLAEELRTEQEHSGAVERGAKVDNIACLDSRNYIMGGERRHQIKYVAVKKYLMPGHLRPVPRAAAEAGGRRGHGGQLRAEDDRQVGGEGQDAGVGAGDLPSQVRSKLGITT